MEPLLTIENLCVDFISDNNVSHALHNISLSVNKGEVVAIVGESGSGKSVTALSILQVIPSPPAVYKNGAIIFNNNGKEIDLLKLTQQEIQLIRGKEIAMIFQEPMSSLNPVQTCGHQVAEMLQLHKSCARPCWRRRWT